MLTGAKVVEFPGFEHAGWGNAERLQLRSAGKTGMSYGSSNVDADRLAGWVGRVIPRAVVPPAGGPLGAMCVECTGEGIVLVEPAPGDEIAAPRSVARRPRAAVEVEAAMVAPVVPPRPTGPTEIERTLAADPDGGNPDADLIDRLDEL
jgi:hypothetical protein